METVEPVVLNLNALSDSFPTIPEGYISRENYINHIESSLSHSRVICINGVEDGVGVTTLLALFADKHSQECISLFNSQYTTAFQTIGFIENSIAKQLNYYLYSLVELNF